jgi:hypothetical protein
VTAIPLNKLTNWQGVRKTDVSEDSMGSRHPSRRTGCCNHSSCANSRAASSRSSPGNAG